MGLNNPTTLIFGATGMLGRELYREARNRGHHVCGVSRHGPDRVVDLLSSDNIVELIQDVAPDVIINSAAIVSHGLCETDPHMAFAVNAQAVGFMARAAGETGAALVQISTDHYYSGDGSAGHAEDSPVVLLNTYARSKYEGEKLALTCDRSLVVRTNITGVRGGEGVTSFFEWVVTVLRGQQHFNLFDDYFTSTISTRQAAEIIFDVISLDVTGVLNVASRDVSSKKQFVEAVAARLGLSTDLASTVSVHGHLSSRAESVGLDVSRAEQVLGYAMPGLKDVVEQLASEYERLASHD